jgi:hypothetical protein
MSRAPDHAGSQEGSSELGEELWNDLFDLRPTEGASPALPEVGREALPVAVHGDHPGAVPTASPGAASVQRPDDAVASAMRPVGTSRPRRRYTLAQVNELAAALRALPAKDPYQRRFLKLAAIAEIADEITALQQRGYTLEEVAGILTAEGVEITFGTLKEYLQRIRIRRDKAAKRARRRSTMPLVLRGSRR